MKFLELSANDIESSFFNYRMVQKKDEFTAQMLLCHSVKKKKKINESQERLYSASYCQTV